MKISSKKIANLITEQLLIREYYRDFESRIRKFGFDSLEDAVNTFLKVPEFREFFVVPGKKIDAKAVLDDTTHLATLDYLMDKMEDSQAKFSPNEKPSEEALQDVADDIEDDPEPTDQEIEQAAEEAGENSTGIKLTKVDKRDIKNALSFLRGQSKMPSGDKLRQAVAKSIQKHIDTTKALGGPSIARAFTQEQAPIIMKIVLDFAKIMDGDFSNLKENRRRKK